MIHTVRKTLSEASDKVGDAEKASIESAISDLEEALKTEDVTEIHAKTNALMESSHKMAEQMYQEQAGEAPAGAGPASGDDTPAGDDVVDAEFEEVKDKKED